MDYVYLFVGSLMVSIGVPAAMHRWSIGALALLIVGGALIGLGL